MKSLKLYLRGKIKVTRIIAVAAILALALAAYHLYWLESRSPDTQPVLPTEEQVATENI